MGAYFSTQIFEPSNSKEVVAEFSHGNVPFLNHYAGLKFLESFFFFTRANMLAYFYFFLVSNQDHPLVFSTVCDYDEDENGNIIKKPDPARIEELKTKLNNGKITNTIIAILR